MALASSMYCDSSNWNPISCTCMESLEEILASVGHGPSKSRWTVPAYVDLIFFPLSCHLQSCSHYRDSCKDSLWGGRSGVPCRLAVFYLLPLGLNDKCGWFGSFVYILFMQLYPIADICFGVLLFIYHIIAGSFPCCCLVVFMNEHFNDCVILHVIYIYTCDFLFVCSCII